MNEEILCSPCCAQAKEVSIKALQRLSTLNRRTLDTIAARIYFYYAWSHEQTGQLADVRRCVPLRMSALMAVNKQCAALMSTVAVSKTLRCLSSSEGFHPGMHRPIQGWHRPCSASWQPAGKQMQAGHAVEHGTLMPCSDKDASRSPT
eukprot:1142366-Pelagomonas_calceolata.AAC.1